MDMCAYTDHSWSILQTLTKLRRSLSDFRVAKVRQTSRPFLWGATVAVFISLATNLNASPTVGVSETWSSPPSLAGWTNSAPIGTTLATLTNPAGEYLRIQFDARDNPGDPPIEDTVYTQGLSYTGSYAEVAGVGFSFLAEDFLPSASAVYMRGSSGTEWERAFTVSQVNNWESFSVAFDYSDGWVGGTEAQFLNDLTDIDAIGVYVSGPLNFDPQDYGLDNWSYYVPEPGTLCMLAAVFASFGMTMLRRRRLHAGIPPVGFGPRTA